MIDTNFSELPTSECFSESEIKDQFNHIKHRLRSFKRRLENYMWSSHMEKCWGSWKHS